MSHIDEIMSMLDWNQPEDVQEKGRQLAKNVKCINVFLQPLHPGFSKNVWENCAKILSERSDEELTFYLFGLFEWLADINWPGAEIIEKRLKRYGNSEKFLFALNQSIHRATVLKDESWLYSLQRFAEMKKGSAIPIDFETVLQMIQEGREIDFSLYKKEYFLYVDWTKSSPVPSVDGSYTRAYSIIEMTSNEEVFSGPIEDLLDFRFQGVASLRDQFSDFKFQCIF